MQQICRLKTRLHAIADGAARQIVTRQEKPWQPTRSFANIFHSLRMTHVVLRQRTWIFPRHAIDRCTGDAQNRGVLRLDLLHQQIIRHFG